MTGKLSREDIIRLLSDKSNREKIIASVLDEAQRVLYEIGDENPEVWEICACGSYVDPDPGGRWPRIVLPEYPHIFVPPIYTNRRGQFVYGPSDLDVVVFTTHEYDPKVEFLRPLEKRANVKKSLRKFTEVTGVSMSLMVASGLFKLGRREAHRYVFGTEKFIVVYER